MVGSILVKGFPNNILGYTFVCTLIFTFNKNDDIIKLK